ncbi:MAG: hypothetical protein Q4G33_06445 [bacterium]|nr:hypothetical protein [bacterium]
MTIKRNGKEYELTAEELFAAYQEQVRLFADMDKTECFCGENECLFPETTEASIVLGTEDYDFFDCEEDEHIDESNECVEACLIDDEFDGEGFDEEAYDELIAEIDSGIFCDDEGD